VSTPTSDPAVPQWLLTVYRAFAYLTGVLLVVLTIALIALLGTEPKPAWYSIAWTLHGWAYMGYVISAFSVSFLMRWNILRTLLVLLAGTIPAMSFVAERWVVRHIRVRAAADATA
jgi:integral membrane protein